MQIRSLAAIAMALALAPSMATASSSIVNKASGSSFTMDFAQDSVTTNIRQMTLLIDPATGAFIGPTAGIYSNILQGNAALTAANPIFSALSIGGAAITAANPLFAALSIGGAVNAVGNPIFATIVGTVPLPTLAATSTKQSDGSQKTQIVDGSGNVIGSTSNNLNIQCANCSGSGVSTGDGASFTAGASLFAGTGGFFQTTATSNPLTTGKQGMAQMTAQRALFSNLRDATGTEEGTVANPLKVDASATAIQGGTIGSAMPSGGNYVMNGVNTNNVVATLHVCGSHVFKHIPTATDTQLVAASGATTIYVCDYSISFGGTTNIFLEKATTGTCATTTQIDMTWYGVANAGKNIGKAYYNGLNTGASAQLCANTSGAAPVDIAVDYDQY